MDVLVRTGAGLAVAAVLALAACGSSSTPGTPEATETAATATRTPLTGQEAFVEDVRAAGVEITRSGAETMSDFLCEQFGIAEDKGVLGRIFPPLRGNIAGSYHVSDLRAEKILVSVVTNICPEFASAIPPGAGT